MPRSARFPEYAELRTPEKDRITLRHLLAMTSGLDWPERAKSLDDPANVLRQGRSAPDPYRFVLARPVETAPGTAWNYNSGGVWLLGPILRKVSGQPIEEFAMALFSLRSGDEVRPAQFDSPEGAIDREMVAIASAIIKQRLGAFDAESYRDRYQDALRALVEAKLKGLPHRRQPAPDPAPVVDLMTALKRSLAKEAAPVEQERAISPRRPKPVRDRRQQTLLLPLSGTRRPKREPAPEPAASARKRRRAGRIG